ncbi:MAG: CsgG/HfaB family protein [Myxococcales bacterium]|nr:CsgG/HfaB family protein [Myxococcales bacterium]
MSIYLTRRSVVAGIASLAAPAWASTPSTTTSEGAVKPTVAVLYFDYEGPDPELPQLRKGFAQMLISDMTGNEGFDVVERDRIQDVIAELQLSATDKIDAARAVKIGKIVGAKYCVFGHYLEVMGVFNVTARVVHTETSVLLKCASNVTGKRADFLQIESQIADELTRGILTEGAECKAPAVGDSGVNPNKSSHTMESLQMDTAIQYGKALDALDNDEPEQAKILLEGVVEEAPEFKLAVDDLEKLLK